MNGGAWQATVHRFAESDTNKDGTSMKESPNIRLLTKANTDNYIDIKTEDVREFIKSNIE